MMSEIRRRRTERRFGGKTRKPLLINTNTYIIEDYARARRGFCHPYSQIELKHRDRVTGNSPRNSLLLCDDAIVKFDGRGTIAV